MNAVSVVIITKNEANMIARNIPKVKLITDDIVVVDNGSADDTVKIATELGCRVYQTKWCGYGANKNKGLQLAQYDWVLSIDADEMPDDELIDAIKNLPLTNPGIVYDIKFTNYFGDKMIRFGSWGRDHHLRLFNRKAVSWSETPVHETLLLPADSKVIRLNGRLHHYSVRDLQECTDKAFHYAKLSAEKFYREGKKATFTKRFLSPLFNFMRNYIVYGGFLDGKEGWYLAKTLVRHTSLKYYYLRQIHRSAQKNQFYLNRNQWAADYSLPI